jgi:hypothetical protein
MYVELFRAWVRSPDAEYLETVRRLRDIAMHQFGCIAFHSLSEGQDEITLS